MTVAGLRRLGSVHEFLDKAHRHMSALVAENPESVHRIIRDFEKSQLWKVYLETGLKFMRGQHDTDLSHEEFEALTDFNYALRKHFQ